MCTHAQLMVGDPCTILGLVNVSVLCSVQCVFWHVWLYGVYVTVVKRCCGSGGCVLLKCSLCGCDGFNFCV